MNKNIGFIWSKSLSDVVDAINIFIDTVDTSYISHGEVFDGRATDFNNWSSELSNVLYEEFSEAAENYFKEKETGHFLAMARVNEVNVGFALIEIKTIKNTNDTTLILHDIVIRKDHQSKSYGTKFLRWLISEGRKKNVNQVILESGINNHKAHGIFKSMGFEITSLVMKKEVRKISMRDLVDRGIL